MEYPLSVKVQINLPFYFPKYTTSCDWDLQINISETLIIYE